MNDLASVVRLVTGHEPDRLAVLAVEINALDASIHRSATRLATDAIELGKRLLEAKGRIPHGEFTSWLEQNCTVSNRSAQVYMQIATSGLDTRSAADLTLRGALEAMTKQVRGTFGLGRNEWHTPPEYIEAAKTVMGAIDLDPASHEVAQRTVQATRFYTAEDDGLARDWAGRVWLNPPYGTELIGRFIQKLADEYVAGHVGQAILLVHSYTDTGWWRVASDRASRVCFTTGRIKFTNVDGEECAPVQGQAFLYYGPLTAEFTDVFSALGEVWQHA